MGVEIQTGLGPDAEDVAHIPTPICEGINNTSSSASTEM